MTTENTARQPKGIPVGGQFAATNHAEADVSLAADSPRAARRAAYNRFAMEADARILELTEDANHAQLRNMVDDLREDHPAAKSFELYVDDDGDILANYVRDTDGNDLQEAEADLNESLRAADPDEMQALSAVPHDVDELLAWEPEGGLAQDPRDPFAHLTGMDKARAQGAFARELNNAAAAVYVEDVTAKVLTANPAAASVFFSRKTDSIDGASFVMDRVEDADGKHLDVDLSSIEDHTFQDQFLDGHLEFDESDDEFFLTLSQGE